MHIQNDAIGFIKKNSTHLLTVLTKRVIFRLEQGNETYETKCLICVIDIRRYAYEYQ